MKYDTERARLALQFLVDSPYYSHYKKRIRSLLSRPRSMPYKDEAEPLNELLVIGRQDPEALDRLLFMVEWKRDDRNEYQRQYMAAKRDRDRRVLQLEALLRGRELTVDEKREVLLKQYEIWHRERLAFVALRATEHRREFGDDPEWRQRNAYAKMFWDSKDAELNALLEEANKTLTKTVKKKRLVVVEPPTPTVMREKLREVLDKRRR